MSAKAYVWIALVSILVYHSQDNFCSALKAENGSDKERPRYRTVYACEGSTLNMECDAGHVINLIRANYGRFSITICNEHGNTEWSVNCMSPRSHRVLHDKCSQRQNCSVAASTRGFGDPCPGTLKYLEAHFQCVPVNPPSHTARPRPPWFIATKTTVSSITQDDPPLQQQRDRPAHNLDHGDDEGGGPDSPGGRISLEERLKGAQSDGNISPMLPAFGDQNRAGTTTSSTTTLRPPPWLITNTTKNTTTTTTTERATTTTATTTTSEEPPATTTLTTTERPPQTNVDSPVSTGIKTDKGVKDKKGNRTKQQSQREEGSGGPHRGEDTDNKEGQPAMSTTTLRPYLAEIPSRSDASDSSPMEASWCPPSSGRGLFWNWTRGGDTAVQPCPGGASGFARRPCDALGWTGPADLSECRSVWLSSLTQRAHTNNDAVLAVAHDLVAVTESRPLFGGDVTATARLLNSLARRMAGDVRNFPEGNQREAIVTELVGAAVETVSHLLSGGRSMAAWADLRGSEHRAAATDLLLGLEEAAFLLADNLHQEKTVNRAQTNILMRLQVLETRNVAAVTFPSTGETWLQEEPDLASSPTDPSSPTSFTDQSYSPTASFPDNGEDVSLSSSSVPSSLPRLPQDTITLPPEALIENSENGLVKMVFFSYDGLQHLLQPDPMSFRYNQNNNLFRDPNETRVLNSRVLSASLGAGRHIELSEPVLLTFAMIRQVNVTNPACVFWDYTTSSWSEEGCRVLRYNRSHTVCECDHLTNFAVLMDVHATPLAYSHSLALSIITYVGCVVSIVCLLLATVVFHAFRGLKSDRTTIHKNLCMCLLLAEVVFLGGVNQTEQVVVCGIVAGLLHFLFLAAFAWMFCEGFQLYIMLVEVFETEKSRVRWYYMGSYGLPAVIVAISAVVDPFSYGTRDACWLRADNYFIFAFVGPVIAVILANCVFLGMSVVIMCRHASISSTLKNKEHTKLASISMWVRGAIVLMFLLGLTWTFGLLYLNQASVVMAYVFTVLNSLQGLFIFIFHCIQNDKKYSFKSCGRDSGHGGSEQEDSPRTGPSSKIASLKMNNNIASHISNDQFAAFNAASPPQMHDGPPLPGPEALLPDYRMTGDTPTLRLPAGTVSNNRMHRNNSPWNHTYTEIPDGIRNHTDSGVDPVYEEIEREGRSDLQISDLSDEDGRRQSSDISRQSSRSYGDHRPLLPYTLPERHNGPHPNQPPPPQYDPRMRARYQQQMQQKDGMMIIENNSLGQHQLGPQVTLDHTIMSPGHILPMSHAAVTTAHALPPGNGHITGHNGHIVGHHFQEQQIMDNGPQQTLDVSSPQLSQAVLAALGHQLPVVHPLSEPNLRNWEAAQRHRDLQHLQQLGEMTVAVLNGEQVVCKLKPPLAPIHESPGGGGMSSAQVERHAPPPAYSHC